MKTKKFSYPHGAQTCAYGRGEKSGSVQSDICQFRGTLKENFCSHVQAILDKIEISSQLIDETHFWLLIFVGKQFKGQFS